MPSSGVGGGVIHFCRARGKKKKGIRKVVEVETGSSGTSQTEIGVKIKKGV